MSSQLPVKQYRLEHSSRVELSLDVEFDITDEDLSLVKTLSDFPLPGSWELVVYREDDDENDGEAELYVGLHHEPGLPEGFFGNDVRTSTTLSWTSEAKTGEIDVGQWDGPLPSLDEEENAMYPGRDLVTPQWEWEKAARASAHQYDPATHRSYRIAITLELAYPKDAAAHAAAFEELARRTAGLNLEQLPHNVRLFFPHAHMDGAELWVKADILSRSSPYLKDLLASDFAEAQPRRSKRARTSGAAEVSPAPAQDEKDFEDSDDETDKFLFSKKPPSLSQSAEADDISFRQITITQAAYSTYHAVLVYLQTGFVHFAPLSSSFPLSEPTFATRRDFLAHKYDEHPSLPLPVSPTSAYRLAHLLQLEDLQKRCLDALRGSLTVKGATAALLSDAALAYDELRKVILEFVREKWDKVKDSEGWKEMKGKAARDEVPSSIVMEAFEVVSDA
ncbi:hypothetical protein JCM10213_002035 [Rhodosporidiobolus nylandii]